MSEVTLYRFFPAWGHTCVSHFVGKVQTYLRMTKIPYKVHSLGLGMYKDHAPKGKLPFIEVDGKKVADSHLIIDELKKRVDLDAHLSELERARGQAVRRMLEEGTNWIIAFERWNSVDEPYFNTTGAGLDGGKVVGFKDLPRQVYDDSVVKFKNDLKSQGVGLYERSEVEALARQDIGALSTLLGDQKYFFGAKPTSVDATAYGFLSHIHRPAFSDSGLKAAMDTKRNLVDYVERIREEFFGTDPTDLDKEVAKK